MRVFPNSFCFQNSSNNYFIILKNIFSKILSQVGVFFDLLKTERKYQEVGFYHRDNSLARSSKYQHYRNLSHRFNITYRIIHPLFRLILWHSYGCIDSGSQFTSFIPKKVRFVKSALHAIATIPGIIF